MQRSTRALNRQALETLATHLWTRRRGGRIWWSARRCAGSAGAGTALPQLERLRDRAGPAFRRSLNRGVRAMFTGPSGTREDIGSAGGRNGAWTSTASTWRQWSTSTSARRSAT
ncbi:MAG: hypothetical protein R2844_23090 [Caldilineales bacterium]